jgi:hypothetical protein
MLLSSSLGNPAVWGPPTWKHLHLIAAKFPEEFTSEEGREQTRRSYALYFTTLKDVLPCAPCRNDYTRLIREDPAYDATVSRYEFSKWVWRIHNRVNAKLGKGTYPWKSLALGYGIANQPTKIVAEGKVFVASSPSSSSSSSSSSSKQNNDDWLTKHMLVAPYSLGCRWHGSDTVAGRRRQFDQFSTSTHRWSTGIIAAPVDVNM